MQVGFVGCGTIAAAIATGIASQETIKIGSIAVSKRSESKSSALAASFPNLVTVHENNQDILDRCDVIFVCVLPKQTSETLQGLTFDKNRHTLVSLVSTAKLDDVVKDSQLPASRVSKMICLPSIARHEGVCLHCCPTPDDSLTKLFQACGGVVSLQTESELEAAMMTSCMMGPLFGIMKEGRDWLLRHTSLPPQEASYLIIQQYIGAVQLAERGSESDPNRLDDLIAEQTTGGLNAQALDNLDKAGGLEAQRKVMDAILSRIRGDSDGSVPSE